MYLVFYLNFKLYLPFSFNLYYMYIWAFFQHLEHCNTLHHICKEKAYISAGRISILPLWEIDHHTGVLRPLLFTNSVSGFFNVLQDLYVQGCCGIGPFVYRPYPRRLEGLPFCRCIYKGSTFSSVFFNYPACWSSRGLNSDLNQQPPARQTGAYPIELTGRRFN